MKQVKLILKFVDFYIRFFLYGIINKIAYNKQSISEKSILLIRLDAIGDYILFRNFIEIIKKNEKYKDYKITLLGNEVWKEIAQKLDSEFIDDFIWLNRRKFNKNLIYRYRKLKEIIKKGYEIVVNPTYSREFYYSDIIVKVLTAKEKIGSEGSLLAVALGITNIFVIPNANYFGRFLPYLKEICENYHGIYHLDMDGGLGLKPSSFVFKFGENFSKTNVFTHIRYNFGDNATHLQYLRMLASKHPEIAFFHFTKKDYINDLKFYVSGLSNLFVLDLFYCPEFSLDVWKNADQFWFKHSKRLNFVEFYIDFFDKLSAKIGLENPIKHKEDFIFDGGLFLDRAKDFPDYDWFIMNSLPLSNQFKSGIAELDEFCVKLSKRFSVITTRKIRDIPCTTDYGMSMPDIAAQSINCGFHLMISTGPSWFVLNTINCERSKGIFLLLDHEEVIFSENMKVFRSVKEFEAFFINSKF